MGSKCEACAGETASVFKSVKNGYRLGLKIQKLEAF